MSQKTFVALVWNEDKDDLVIPMLDTLAKRKDLRLLSMTEAEMFRIEHRADVAESKKNWKAMMGKKKLNKVV